MKIHVQHVSFSPEGDIEVAYFDKDSDVKAPGVARLHTLVVPAGFDYNDEMEALHEAAVYLVRDVLDDFEQLPPAELHPDVS